MEIMKIKANNDCKSKQQNFGLISIDLFGKTPIIGISNDRFFADVVSIGDINFSSRKAVEASKRTLLNPIMDAIARNDNLKKYEGFLSENEREPVKTPEFDTLKGLLLEIIEEAEKKIGLGGSYAKFLKKLIKDSDETKVLYNGKDSLTFVNLEA